MKRILVPFDFSEKAIYAVKTASDIALSHQCELHILHIINVHEGVVDPMSLNDFESVSEKVAYIKAAQEKFKKFKKSDFLKNLELKDTVIYNNSHESIIYESKKNNIDLIVIGSNITSGLEEILIGSNTEKLVRNSEIPVLIIKNDIECLKIKNIVFASNFKFKEQKLFQKIIDFANFFNAKLHLVKVNTIQNFQTTGETKSEIDKFISKFKIDNYTFCIYNDINIESGIVNYAHSINADIIAITTHGRKGLAQLLIGSISEDISNHAKLPVITFKI